MRLESYLTNIFYDLDQIENLDDYYIRTAEKDSTITFQVIIFVSDPEKFPETKIHKSEKHQTITPCITELVERYA